MIIVAWTCLNPRQGWINKAALWSIENKQDLKQRAFEHLFNEKHMSDYDTCSRYKSGTVVTFKSDANLSVLDAKNIALKLHVDENFVDFRVDDVKKV